MPEDKPNLHPKIDTAFQEISFAEGLKVDIANGRIVKIHKGKYLAPEKNGIQKEVEVREDITI